MRQQTQTIPAGLRRCDLHSQRTINSLRAFMRKYGDGLPEKTIREATAKAKMRYWTALCDGAGAVKAATRYDPNDWYLCTLKNAAVAPELRGRGVGSWMYQRNAEAALRDKTPEGKPRCHVLAGDVTFDNMASRKAAERAGMRAVNKFCWGKGQKPAAILHYVRVRPQGNRCK